MTKLETLQEKVLSLKTKRSNIDREIALLEIKISNIIRHEEGLRLSNMKKELSSNSEDQNSLQ